MIGDMEMRVDLGRDLCMPHERKLVIVALHGAAAFERDVLGHKLTEAINNGTLRLGHRAAGINNLPPDIEHRPHFVDFQSLVRVDTHLRDLCHVTEVAVLEGDSSSASLRETA